MAEKIKLRILRWRGYPGLSMFTQSHLKGSYTWERQEGHVTDDIRMMRSWVKESRWFVGAGKGKERFFLDLSEKAPSCQLFDFIPKRPMIITSHLIFYYQSIFIKSAKVKGSSIRKKNFATKKKKKVNRSQGQTGMAASSEGRAWTVPYEGTESLASSSPHNTWLPRRRVRWYSFHSHIWVTLVPTYVPVTAPTYCGQCKTSGHPSGSFLPSQAGIREERQRRQTIASSSKIKGKI